MVREALGLMRPRSGGVYCDGTAGQGGHALALLEASGPASRLLAIDRDAGAVQRVRELLAPYGHRAIVVHARFGELPDVLARLGLGRLDGVLVDLGVSSVQLDDPERGLSFQRRGPLDMRLDRSRGEAAEALIDRLSERELADVIHAYGEERRARSVARAIKAARRDGELRDTLGLAEVVRRAVGARRSGRIDAATRSFQALRMAVNDELGELEGLLGAPCSSASIPSRTGRSSAPCDPGPGVDASPACRAAAAAARC
jgi:16S rRNA (cytosine1402-N4)-methyltransferase